MPSATSFIRGLLAAHWGQERVQCRLKNRAIAFLTIFEVKTDDSFGYPFQAVNKKEKAKIEKLSLALFEKAGKESPVRFDVLGIFCMDNGKKELEHIKDAFEV